MTSVDFACDLLGNITEVSPPNRPAYTMNSDYRGDMLDMTTPGGTLHSYVFDLDHRLTSATMGDGRGWTLAYDSSNRLDQINVGVEVYDFNYGEDAHLAEALGGEANIAFVWDGPLPISQTTSGAVNGSVDWTWEDATLSLGSMSINGEVIDYTYDKDGLPLQIGAESLSYLANTYFLKQRKVGTAQVDYTYSEFGELSELRARTGTDLLRAQYTRDDLGRITQAQEALQGTTTTYDYSYDLLGQIVEVRVNGAVSATYSYDSNSNRIGVVSAAETVTSAQITLNADDQLTRYGSTLYQYNAAGQRTRKSDGAAVTDYTYGVMGELQQVVLPDGRTLTYQYDALKRRIGRKINGTTTHRYLWAGGLSPVAEVDANGVTTTAYVYGTGINVPDYMVRGGVTYMFVRDHLGSVRFVVNAATGSVVQELRYDTFGQVLLDTNPGFQPFGFAGGLYDPDTSLTRFGARDYDSQIGRWTARDPVAFGGGQANLYIYVGNDPVNFVDRNGTFAWAAALAGSFLNGALNGFGVWASGGQFWKGFVVGAGTGWLIAVPAHPSVTGGLIGLCTSALNEVWASPSDSPMRNIVFSTGLGAVVPLLGPLASKLGFIDEIATSPHLLKLTDEVTAFVAGIWANAAPGILDFIEMLF
jgi:RHS repeat-associated protein